MTTGGDQEALSAIGEYGAPLAAYAATGQLRCGDGQTQSCRCHCGQLRDGNVILLCYMNDFVPLDDQQVVGFSGTDNQGNRLAAELLDDLAYLPEVQDYGQYAAYRARELRVVCDDAARAPGRLRFGVTNLRFASTSTLTTRNEEGVLSSVVRVLPLQLAGPGGVWSLSIRPTGDQDRVVQGLVTNRGIDVTGEIVVESAPTSDLAVARQLVTDLCFLLSIARGTKVQWIYVDEYGADGRVLRRTHCNHITRRFGPLEPLDHRPTAADDTRRFLEAGYEEFVKKAAGFRLRTGLVDAYLDAKSEGNFLEVRGVKLAVVVEMFKSIFLETPAGKLAPKKPFLQVLKKLCTYLGLNVEGTEVRLFVECRNTLVHGCRFYVDGGPPAKKKKLPPRPNPTDEFLFLVSFVDRLFLRLLGYKGKFLDWGRYPNVEAGVLQ